MSLQDGILYFKGYLYQYVPVSDDVTYTFAAKFSDGYILCVSGTASQVQSADLGNAHITFYHQSEMPYPQVTISTLDDTQPIGLLWAALYEGVYTADTLPPYIPKGYAAELAQCKRYYNIIPYDMDDYYVNANTAYPSMYPVSFPEMRIVPTVTLQESWNTGSAGVSVGFITKSSLAFQAAATSSRVAWHGKIKLNADL